LLKSSAVLGAASDGETSAVVDRSTVASVVMLILERRVLPISGPLSPCEIGNGKVSEP
jgi:hypothetical protein